MNSAGNLHIIVLFVLLYNLKIFANYFLMQSSSESSLLKKAVDESCKVTEENHLPAK